jgi:hypothetical protein
MQLNGPSCRFARLLTNAEGLQLSSCGDVVSVIGQHMKQASRLAKTIFITRSSLSAGFIPDDAICPKVRGRSQLRGSNQVVLKTQLSMDWFDR